MPQYPAAPTAPSAAGVRRLVAAARSAIVAPPSSARLISRLERIAPRTAVHRAAALLGAGRDAAAAGALAGGTPVAVERELLIAARIAALGIAATPAGDPLPALVAPARGLPPATAAAEFLERQIGERSAAIGSIALGEAVAGALLLDPERVGPARLEEAAHELLEIALNGGQRIDGRIAVSARILLMAADRGAGRSIDPDEAAGVAAAAAALLVAAGAAGDDPRERFELLWLAPALSEVAAATAAPAGAGIAAALRAARLAPAYAARG
jgi:hypothetical protein